MGVEEVARTGDFLGRNAIGGGARRTIAARARSAEPGPELMAEVEAERRRSGFDDGDRWLHHEARTTHRRGGRRLDAAGSRSGASVPRSRNRRAGPGTSGSGRPSSTPATGGIGARGPASPRFDPPPGVRSSSGSPSGSGTSGPPYLSGPSAPCGRSGARGRRGPRSVRGAAKPFRLGECRYLPPLPGDPPGTTRRPRRAESRRGSPERGRSRHRARARARVGESGRRRGCTDMAGGSSQG